MYATLRGTNDLMDEIRDEAQHPDEAEGFSPPSEPVEPTRLVAPNSPPSGEYHSVNHGW